jgi:hypothetical protein
MRKPLTKTVRNKEEDYEENQISRRLSMGRCNCGKSV